MNRRAFLQSSVSAVVAGIAGKLLPAAPQEPELDISLISGNTSALDAIDWDKVLPRHVVATMSVAEKRATLNRHLAEIYRGRR